MPPKARQNGNGRHLPAVANGRKPGQPLKNQQQSAAPKDVDDEILRTRALDLRREGASYRAIASALTDELGRQGIDRKIGKDVAHRLVTEALAEIRKANAESAEEVRQLELDRLDVWMLRLNTGKKRSEPRVIDTMLRISESRRKLLGIDAATKLGIGGLDGGPIEVLVNPKDAVRGKLDALKRVMLASSPAAVAVVEAAQSAAADAGPTTTTE